MRNSLTFTPDFANNRVQVSIGNPGGAHSMFLSLSDVLTLEEWIANVRHETLPKRLVISQTTRVSQFPLAFGETGA